MMDTISGKFFSFVKISVLTALSFVVLVVLLSLLPGPNFNDAVNMNMSILLTVTAAAGITALMSKTKDNYKMLFLIGLAFMVRLIWTLNVPSVPVSDFQTLYETAENFLVGNKSNLEGFGYLARFPHLVPMMVYVMGMMKVFGAHHVFAIKTVALLLSVLNVYLIYVLMSYYTKKSSTRLIAMLFAVIFPPFITYCSTYCTETIGVTFFLLSMITFHKALNAEKHKFWRFMLCGGILYLGDMFRAVTIILIIAYIMYITIFSKGKKIQSIAGFLAGYFIIAVSASTILMTTDVIEQPLWKGKEPVVATLMLKGSNFESHGAWNVEDATFVDERLGTDNLAGQCFERIGQRLSERSIGEIVGLYAVKFLSQWSVGDFSGTYWATHSTYVPYHFPLPYVFQLIYFVILIFALCTFKSKKENKELALLYILLCGFGIAFTLLETQGRYSYIISWVFLILASIGIENLNLSKDTLPKLKEKFSKKNQIIKYLLFYIAVTSLNKALLFITNTLLGGPYIITNILLWLLSVSVAYFICKSWVFNNRVFETATLLKEAPLFLICTVISGLVYSGITWLGLDYLCVSTWELPFNINVMPMLSVVLSLIIKIIAIVATITLNYIGSKFIFNKFRKEKQL